MSMQPSLYQHIIDQLQAQELTVISQDLDRPWGGFLVIDEQQAASFIQHYFTDIDPHSLIKTGRLSPKILVVQPGQRLSWQYHHRRAEIWQVIQGPVGIMSSPSDQQTQVVEHAPGQQITLAQGQRHRLIGLQNWGVVAEIWQHTDPNHPSDEDDIIRVQDDFGR